MSWINKIQEAIDYIENNLLDDVTSESIGKAISYSPSSFQNLFSAITGYSIGEYIRFRRLSSAIDDIESGSSILDAALKYNYETPESFSKAFKRLFGCSPSKYSGNSSLKFDPIKITHEINGGFNMKRNVILNMRNVDWSDTQRQNEFVNSVVSALNCLGESCDYDYVCAVSGSAFRTSFSMASSQKWNHGNYHVINTPMIVEHTFKMLGYDVSVYPRGDYQHDKKLIIDSIDKGIPVITLEGIINCSDACIISGYDNDGDVLLGYNPFMSIEEDHDESPDDTGYFRKSNWHNSNFDEGTTGQIVIINRKVDKLDKKQVFEETLRLIRDLIEKENICLGQYNGLAAHQGFVNALRTYEWDDNFEPYLNVMCNYKQYLDRQYAINFFEMNGRSDLSNVYQEISNLSKKMGNMVPQDFSAFDVFSDKDKLESYCELILKVLELEKKVLDIL